MNNVFLKSGAPRSQTDRPSPWHHILSWYPAYAAPNLLFLFYEDIVQARSPSLIASHLQGYHLRHAGMPIHGTDFPGPAAGLDAVALQSIAVVACPCPTQCARMHKASCMRTTASRDVSWRQSAHSPTWLLPGALQVYRHHAWHPCSHCCQYPRPTRAHISSHAFTCKSQYRPCIAEWGNCSSASACSTSASASGWWRTSWTFPWTMLWRRWCCSRRPKRA